jgi:hypothetical protein
MKKVLKNKRKLNIRVARCYLEAGAGEAGAIGLDAAIGLEADKASLCKRRASFLLAISSSIIHVS